MRCFIALLCLLSFTASADITVVTSITPLQQITQAIMQGVGTPKLLIKQKVSAHHFAFKPSHFRLLKDAELVIWIDRHFESGFQRLPEILRKQSKTVELLRELDLHGQDGHIWYSPDLLPLIVEKIRIALSDINPEHSTDYARNSHDFIQQIDTWADQTRIQINKKKPLYLLDHDFLSHFENDFATNAIAVLHDSHDQNGSIRELQLIERALLDTPAKCLLINEAPASKLGRNMAQKFNLKIHNIAFTADHQPQKQSFIDSLRRLSAILAQCSE